MDLTVFIAGSEATCCECGAELGRHAWITLVDLKQNPEKAPADRSRQQAAENSGALCLSCADLDHLIYLPSGDAALTRRARKYSTLAAVVLQWNRSRKRYERQGILVEEEALEKAEQECLADQDARARRRERDAVRREELDQRYVEQFAKRVRELYPGCPSGRETVIAEHACQKYSGRVGRSASAKELNEKAVRLAVVAHIRHTETDYDTLLAGGTERSDARAQIEPVIDRTLARWVSAS